MTNDSPVQKKEEEMKGSYELAEAVLAEDEDARNSDTVLVNIIWQHQSKQLHGKDLQDLTTEEAKKLTPSGSIVRARRKIQNDEGRYPPTEAEVIEQRAKNEEIVKEWSKTNMQEKLTT